MMKWLPTVLISFFSISISISISTPGLAEERSPEGVHPDESTFLTCVTDLPGAPSYHVVVRSTARPGYSLPLAIYYLEKTWPNPEQPSVRFYIGDETEVDLGSPADSQLVFRDFGRAGYLLIYQRAERTLIDIHLNPLLHSGAEKIRTAEPLTDYHCERKERETETEATVSPGV